MVNKVDTIWNIAKKLRPSYPTAAQLTLLCNSIRHHLLPSQESYQAYSLPCTSKTRFDSNNIINDVHRHSLATQHIPHIHKLHEVAFTAKMMLRVFLLISATVIVATTTATAPHATSISSSSTMTSSSPISRSNSSGSLSRNKSRLMPSHHHPVYILRGGSMGDDTDDEAVDNEEESEELPSTSSTRQLHPLQSTLVNTLHNLRCALVPKYASLYTMMVYRVTKRSLRAGWLAIVDDGDAVEVKELDGFDGPSQMKKQLPQLQSVLGKTLYVLEEMYHAALTPGAEKKTTTGEELLKGDSKCDESSRRRKRKHRRKGTRSSTTNDESTSTKRHHKRRKHRHHHHHHHRHTSSPTKIVCNGGGMDHPSDTNNSGQEAAIRQLAEQYNLANDDNINLQQCQSSVLVSSHTSLNEALQKANSDARFLICYISRGNGKTAASVSKSSQIAIPNLLNRQFVKHINRKPLGKKQSGDTGSYYVWVCDGDDGKEAEMAMKRLKVKPPTSISSSSGAKKKKSSKDTAPLPILAIVYPASTIDPSTNRLKVTPRLLAQHHCNPPPSNPEIMSAWSSSIRKRHIREFAKLQHDRKELELFKERNEGYIASVNEDRDRQKREEEERERKRVAEEEERKRLEQIKERRKELLDALVKEPDAGEGVITIALRFQQPQQQQSPSSSPKTRRFNAAATSMNDVFNWIDAVHGMERETVELSSMNGARRFVYVEEETGDSSDDDEKETSRDGESVNRTLEEVGLGKMTALRVSVLEENGGESNGGEADDEEEE